MIKGSFLTLIVLMMTISNQSWACGGEDLTDDEVKAAKPVLKVLSAISAGLEQKFEIEKIVRAGNSILDLDEKETVRAMCSANFTHVYFKSDEGTRCLTVLDIRQNKRIHEDFDTTFASCRSAGGEVKRFELK